MDMRVILSSVLFVLFMGLVALAFMRRPLVAAYKDCYLKQKEAVTEENLLAKRTYTSESQICETKKELLLDAYVCFVEAEDTNISKTETQIIDYIAKSLSQTSRTIDEAIEDFNRLCTPHDVDITAYELDKLRFSIQGY